MQTVQLKKADPIGDYSVSVLYISNDALKLLPRYAQGFKNQREQCNATINEGYYLPMIANTLICGIERGKKTGTAC